MVPTNTIDRFEIAKPSLDDIFITVVKEGVPENMAHVVEAADA